jgi:hypothetical protein
LNNSSISRGLDNRFAAGSEPPVADRRQGSFRGPGASDPSDPTDPTPTDPTDLSDLSGTSAFTAIPTTPVNTIIPASQPDCRTQTRSIMAQSLSSMRISAGSAEQAASNGR